MHKRCGIYLDDLYLSTDVLLLADVFVDFHNMCLETYKLDPLHYYGVPSFAWNAMLKHTNISIELMKDYNMVLMSEVAKHGGLCQTAH
jgi:hypothetical protein